MKKYSKEVEKLFEKEVKEVRYDIYIKKYMYLFDSTDELINEINIILLKACNGWIKNNVSERGVYFYYHLDQYIRGYMSSRYKQYIRSNDALNKCDWNSEVEDILRDIEGIY